MTITVDVLTVLALILLLVSVGALMLASALLTGLLVLRARGIHEPLRAPRGASSRPMGSPLGSPFESDEQMEDETKRAVLRKMLDWWQEDYTPEQRDARKKASEQTEAKLEEMRARRDEQMRKGADSVYGAPDTEMTGEQGEGE